jgi:oxygen-independent coproporphyrinogen-3 oxidase
LSEAAALGAEHLSPYQLTIEAGTAFGRAAARGRLVTVDADTGAELYETTQTVLEGLGYEAYEVSNHARGAAAQSRHNLTYWRGEDYVGVGPGAHGRLTLGPARWATEAHPRVADYVAAVRAQGVGWRGSEALADADVAQERLLMGLRTREGVAWPELAPLGLAPANARVQSSIALGLVDPRPDRLRATAAGRLVLDRLIAELAH